MQELETLTYQEFLSQLSHLWHPGQHIGIIGPAGSGKSWLGRYILSIPRFAVVIATKKKDKTLDSYNGFKKMDRWPPREDIHKVIYWKKPQHLGDFSTQQVAIYQVLDDVFKRGGYTVSFDDLFYMQNSLHLESALRMLYTQVRSNGVSLVGLMQRPKRILIEAINQATFLCVFRIHDKLDVDRVAEEMSINRKDFQAAMDSLGQYEFLFLEIGKAPIKVLKEGA